VTVRETRQGAFSRKSPPALIASSPASDGGRRPRQRPNPYDLLLAALGACTAMTLRLYAERKALPLDQVTVRLRHGKVHAADCETCETKDGMVDRIERALRSREGSMRMSGAACSRSPTSVRSTAR